MRNREQTKLDVLDVWDSPMGLLIRAREVGEALGYPTGGHFARNFRGKWAHVFKEGRDFWKGERRALWVSYGAMIAAIGLSLAEENCHEDDAREVLQQILYLESSNE